MDNSNFSRNRQTEHLGVNKIGKNIRKSPIHQPNFGNPNPNRQQPQPQVYNISKTDFRSIVQQLTGSPSQDPRPVPPHNPPKPPSMRLQRIRPPPLTPINRPPLPNQVPPPRPPPHVPYNNSFRPPPQYGHPSPGSNFVRPPPQYGLPSPTPMPPPYTTGEAPWPNTAESPISAYMRYLIDTTPRQNAPHGQIPNHLHPHPHPQPPYPPQGPAYPPSAGLLPNPQAPPFPSPRGPGPALLPSPTSQFLLPSPSGYLNLLSPRSPYPLLSPGFQYPPPTTPGFSFSPMVQPGILGPGPPQQLPPSPGLMFPLSPSMFSSPRWRDQ